MYDEVMRVPSIIRAKGRIAPGTELSALTQQMDIADYLLRAAGVAFPDGWQAEELCFEENLGREYVYAEHARDHFLPDEDFMSMIRSQTHKLVHYDGKNYGELYDLIKDPREKTNEWNNPEYRTIRDALRTRLQEFRAER